MPSPNITADDVIVALREFDSLGRTAFLAKYGFGEARRYFLRHDGQDYDSKAVVGAAHTRRHGVPLRAADFTGGEATVKKLLEALGFEVFVRTAAQTDTAVSETSLGAWVLKCNPDVWDLAGFIADGERQINDWTVAQNYRSEMMRYGQRVLFWVTGPAIGDLPRGFWGSGWVTGQPRGLVALDERPGDLDIDYWLDLDARDRMRFAAPVNLRIWGEPIIEGRVRSVPGLEKIEVIKMRQASNPSWISSEQLELLEPILPAWPDIGAAASETVTIKPFGAGYGDPLTRAVVEEAAIRAVKKHFLASGHEVESVERDKCGWDLTCSAADGTVARVEVKGVSGSRPDVLLTRNEYRSAMNDSGWVLAVVTRAITAPKVAIYTPDQVRAAATTFLYRADFSTPG